MRDRAALLARIARQAVRVPDKAAHALIIRDSDAWLRLQFLGVASRTGIADRLPAAPEELGFADVDLARAFLDLGVGLNQVRRDKAGRYHAKGRRLKAVIGRHSPALSGYVEELVAFDGPVYTNLEDHLRGGPKRDYLDGLGDVVARVSRLAEPALAATVQALVADLQPKTVLDVGCGTGIYVKHVLDAAPDTDVLGIDLNADAIANAVVDQRYLRRQDLFETDGRYDLVLLLQSIYYWPPEERPRVIAKLKELGTTVVVACAVADGPCFNRHFDMILRVTEGNYRLPTKAELTALGLDVTEPVPGVGYVVAVARPVPRPQAQAQPSPGCQSG